MPYSSLSDFIGTLEKQGELVRIHEQVSPVLEITEITDRVIKNGGKALLFENTGTEFPLLINAFGSEKRMCLSLGLSRLDDVKDEIALLLQTFMKPREGLIEKLRILPVLQELSSWMPKTLQRKGSCQEMIMEKPDLTRLPVLTCWPHDGGPFITLPVVHTVDPITGLRNTGMYRMQVFDPVTTGMHWHLHKGSAAHFNRYRDLGKRMPVTVTLGGDPAYTYVATAPLPENIDEYLLAGFLRKKKVEMVRCLTNPLQVPADVDFVIEGYVDPSEEFILEGPFGDHTGYYSLADYYPKFHVTCITHRKNAVYPATIVGIPPMEDGWIGKATERIFLGPIKLSVAPEVTDMDMPVEGVFHNITLAAIRKTFPGQGLKVMNSLWGAGQMMFNKILLVVPEEVDVHDYRTVAQHISAAVNPLLDIQFVKGPADVLDHSSRKFAFGSKLGVDGTQDRPSGTTPGAPFGFIPDETAIRKTCPAIREIHAGLLADGISLLILTLRKERRGQVRETAETLMKSGLTGPVKFILFMDDTADPEHYADIAWIAANNIDPVYDCFLIPGNEKPYPCLMIDGTRKDPRLDDFDREWPNILVMDDEVISKIDGNWDLYGLGSMIPSPSLRYKSLKINDGATVIPVDSRKN